MTNGDKFFEVFGLYATELWAKPEEEFLEWLNTLFERDNFEWCTGCKEYDHEAHCCHRWNKLIKKTIEDMKANEQTVKVVSVDKPIEGSDRTIHVTCCEGCERVVGISDDYCPGCGARLEWECMRKEGNR